MRTALKQKMLASAALAHVGTDSGGGRKVLLPNHCEESQSFHIQSTNAYKTPLHVNEKLSVSVLRKLTTKGDT